MKPKVGIISAGALGTALAQSISKNNDNILLWGRNPELINEINNEHTNSKYYPNFQLIAIKALDEHYTKILESRKLYYFNNNFKIEGNRVKFINEKSISIYKTDSINNINISAIFNEKCFFFTITNFLNNYFIRI